MIEIEKYPCKDANEALARERYWFERLNSSLNGQFPQRKRAEYCNDNRDKFLLQSREYRKNNRDDIVLKSKKTFVCECGKSLTWCHKSSHSRTKSHLEKMNTLGAIPFIEYP
jgi:hypothetical protein